MPGAARHDLDNAQTRDMFLAGPGPQAKPLKSQLFNSGRERADLILTLSRWHFVIVSRPWAIDAFSARVGPLLGYGHDFATAMARHAEYIDRILRGAKRSELPVEQATKVQLGIDLKMAEPSVMVPPGLLARADEVIE